MNKDDILENIKKYYWYHCISMGNDIISDGDYDLRDIVHLYGFPDDMSGMSVLDVGRASGYFAFEFEERGAEVIATDIKSFFDWDFVGGAAERDKRLKVIENDEEFSEREIFGAFNFAREVRQSKVESKLINVYDICPEAFGGKKFDLVFAGSITSHLRDPILALERLFSVTRGKCIVAVPMFKIPEAEHLPIMSLVGTMDSDRRSWWVMNSKCIVEMMKCANFQDIQITSEFDLINKRVAGLSVPHLVVHGHAP